MLKRIGFIILIIIFLAIAFVLYAKKNQKTIPEVVQNIVQPTPSNPMQIAYMREQNYPGSSITISETLKPGSNYKRYIAYYYSDNLKIYGLLTVPNSTKPIGGFPAIIFNHGYITPQLYTPDGNYIAYVDALSKAGYAVFKPDYRGNGRSEGSYGSEYFSRNYDIDDLNAIASIEKFDEVNPSKIGIWGHSMGGHITLMDLEIAKNIKAAVIWGGVVGSYNDILYNWQNRVTYQPDAEDLRLRNQRSQEMLNMYGTPTQNPSFWDSIDPTKNLNYVNTPVQIHVGGSDNQVPPDFGESLYNSLKSLNKTTEFYSYPGANHDINQGFDLAMQRTIQFFDKYLK